MPEDLQENLRDANSVIVNLMFNDLDLAFTFLQTANVTSVSETRERNVAHALKAYRAVLVKILRVEMTAPTRQDLERTIVVLENQLRDFQQLP